MTGPLSNTDQPDQPNPSTSAGDGLKPSAMRGSEEKYGLGVAVILLVVAIANVAIRHGKGAPKHPSTGLAIVGLVAAVAVFPLLRTKSRFIVPFGALLAGLFVNLPNGPNSVKSLHVLALVFPLAYALVLTSRQRKLAMAEARNRAAARSSGTPRPARDRRSGRRQKEEQPSGPSANRRYTPPKPKRARR